MPKKRPDKQQNQEEPPVSAKFGEVAVMCANPLGLGLHCFVEYDPAARQHDRQAATVITPPQCTFDWVMSYAQWCSIRDFRCQGHLDIVV